MSSDVIYWKQFDRQRWHYLRWGTGVMLRALRAQVRPVVSFLRENGLHDTESALDNIIKEKPVQDAFDTLYGKVGGEFAQTTFSRFQKAQKNQDDFIRAVNAWIKLHGGDRIGDITNVSISRTRLVLQGAISQGLSIPKAAEMVIRNNLAVGARRATVIARTEIIAASNRGSLQGAMSTGLPMGKSWISFQDGRTREDHIGVAPVETLTSLFNVGGEEMEFPGDWTHGASAENIIQCRCTQGYKVY